jgi:branched-subunit amino acid transport protein
MSDENLLLILGMAVVTFIPRFIPLAFLSRRAIPERIKAALEYIPVAILSAIVFPILF